MVFWKEHFLAWSEIQAHNIGSGSVTPFDVRDQVFISYANEKSKTEDDLREHIRELEEQLNNIKRD